MAEKGQRVYRSKYRRLIELDRQIRARKYPNAGSFAAEWEVSRRTIVRDLEFMRDSLLAPLEYDAGRRGYFYSDPIWTLPQVELTEAELLHLLVAERMAQQFQGTPIADTLESLFEKLRHLLPDSVSADPVFFQEHFSFHGRPSRPIQEKVWLPIFRALREQRVIQFPYKAASKDIAEKREVEPLHLACLADEWYLIAYDRDRQGIRQFAVSRISSTPKIRSEFFERDFDARSYLENRFGRYVGVEGKQHKIVVKFDSETADWILERQWHPKQKITRHRDGSLTLTFPSPTLYEVKRWVLQWGEHAKVIEPQELVIGIKDTAKKTLREYR